MFGERGRGFFGHTARTSLARHLQIASEQIHGISGPKLLTNYSAPHTPDAKKT